MATDSPQRAYRAPCPGCGAPVEFRSAQSTHAVCSFCRSTVVRDGDTLSRIGKMAEVFQDYSPLQLGANGTWNGKGFALVGRLQYRYGEGSWNEWIASFDDGTTGVLSEDNGSFVFSVPAQLSREAPAPAQLRVGASTAVRGKTFSVASNEQVSLAAAEGELPKLPPIGTPFALVELRSADGEVFSIDYGSQPPQTQLGRAVLLDELKLVGLKQESAKEDKGRLFNCPNCGAEVSLTLGTSKAVTCRSCNSIIDLSQGIGGELRHAEQDEPVSPLIPLGSKGQLQGVHWQVVGFQHRMGWDPQDSDERFGWEEYLLYNAKRGFSFLVDSTEGWSVVKPTTGAPILSAGGDVAVHLGSHYKLKEAYDAETTYVAGEFYWQVQRGQKTSNRDFESGKALLSMEQSRNEVVWSSGSKIESEAVAKAFKLEHKQELMKRADVSPVAGQGMGCLVIIGMFVAIMVLVVALRSCNTCDPQTENCSGSSHYRSSGGSFGGFSGGGGGGK